MVAAPQDQQAQPPVDDTAGAAIYRDSCAACHGDKMEGMPPSSPSLAALGTRMNAAQASDLIHKGKGDMPALPDIEGPNLEALLRYLRIGIGDQKPDAADELSSDKYTFTGYRKFLDPDGYPAVADPSTDLATILTPCGFPGKRRRRECQSPTR